MTEAPARRPRSGGDIAGSIGLLVGAAVVWVSGFAAGLFVDVMTGAGCDSGVRVCGGFVMILTAALLVVAGVAGTITTIVRLALRRRGWVVAAITVGVVIVGWVAAIVIAAFLNA